MGIVYHLLCFCALSSHHVVILHTSNITIAELDPISAVLFLDRHQVRELVVFLCLGFLVGMPCILGTLVPVAEDFWLRSLVLEYRHYRNSPSFQFVEVVDHIPAGVVAIVVIDTRVHRLQSRIQNYYSVRVSRYALVHQDLSMVRVEGRTDHLGLVLVMDHEEAH